MPVLMTAYHDQLHTYAERRDLICDALRHGEFLPDPCPGCLAELEVDALLVELAAAVERAEAAEAQLVSLGDSNWCKRL